MMVIAVVVVLIPVLGLRMLASEPEEVQVTGSVTLTEGNRLLFLTGQHIATRMLGESGPTGSASVAELQCERVYAAGGTGVCLRKNNALTYSATILDRQLSSIGTFPLSGLPSLARVSPSGRMVAWSSFEQGSAYTGAFVTRTAILDTQSESLTDPAEFSMKVGKKTAKGTPQLWGVTFADDNRFYATAAVGDVRHLVVGDLAARTLESVARDVTSPAISADGSQIAFVRKVKTDGEHWQLFVMDLATGKERPLSDRRGINDQPVWLGPERVAYVVRSNDGTPSIWAVGTRDGARPALLQDNADSPSPL